MAALIATICYLYQILFLSASSAANTGGWHERQLEVLKEVVTGPARGRLLVFHLEDALPADVQGTVMNMEEIQRSPHITLSLNLNQSQGIQLRKEAFSSFMLHVVVWLALRPEALQELWHHWKPRNLLLFSLESSLAVDVLLDKALSGVEKIAFIGHITTDTDRDSDALGVYTVMPFSSGVQLLGHWERESFSSWEALFPDRFPSFHGYTFHLATYLNDPPFLYEQISMTGNIPIGMALRLFELFSHKLNFTYTMTRESPDLKWGGKENGSWMGLLGMIARKEQNFTIHGLSLTEERVETFDPTEMMGTDYCKVFLPIPSPIPEWLSLMRPFLPSVWISLLIMLLLACSLMYLQAKHANTGSPHGAASVGSWLELHRGLVSQSVPTLPRAPWQQVFLGVWLLCCLVVTAAYTCNLVGIFTRPAYSRRLRTLQELADSDLRIAVINDGAYTLTLLKDSNETLLRRLHAKTDLVPALKDAIHYMARGTHAMIGFDPVQRLRLIRGGLHVDKWYALEEALSSNPTVWYFPKHTPWKTKFDVGIRQVSRSGLAQHWYQFALDQWVKVNMPRDTVGAAAVSDYAPSLSLRHLQGVFYVLIVAWVISGAILVLELLVHRHYRGRSFIACRR